MYIALLEDEKTLINKSSLELIRAIPSPIKYLFKLEFDSHVKVGPNEADLYAYTAVNLDDNYSPVELDNFLIIDLGTDYFGKYASERHTFIKEKRSGEIRKFHSVGDASQFILYFLAPLIRTLENAGSWDAFDKFRELDEVKKENQILKEQIRALEKS